jgi:hypothetical protein
LVIGLVILDMLAQPAAACAILLRAPEDALLEAFVVLAQILVAWFLLKEPALRVTLSVAIFAPTSGPDTAVFVPSRTLRECTTTVSAPVL